MAEQISIYQALGEEKIMELVSYFYEEVAQKQELRNLYPEDLGPAEERLFWFLMHVFGGPSPYLEKRGHPMLRRRHFQWKIDGRQRDNWLNCMFRAIDKVEMDQVVREGLHNYFIKTAQHMINS